MPYTIDKNPRVDAKIAQDQEYINSKVLGILGNHIHSILLCGGFGRGEGSVELRHDEIHIVNDYDITIVVKERNLFNYARIYKKYHSALQALAEELATDLKMKQVDLALKSRSYFENRETLKIDNYEVKQGHVLTYGKDDPTKAMPDWRAEDIPLFEGTWLFRNRGAGMLIAALYFLHGDGIAEEKKENFVIECGKAQLAMGDSILLLKSHYHHHYSERLRSIDSLDVSDIPEGDRILANYQEALEHKLRPNFDKFYQRELINWWFDISELLDIFYRYFEMKRLKIQFADWQEYAYLPKPEDRFELKAFIGSLLRNHASVFSPDAMRRNLLKARKSHFLSIVPLLLFSLQKDNFFLPYMEKVSRLLDVPLDVDSKNDWLRLVRTFLYELHPGGEVAKAIRL